jgi:hypothetical protein
MPFTLVSIVRDRPRHRHYHCDPYVPARRIHDLCFRRVTLTPIPGGLSMNVTGTFTAPVTRKSGTALALTDIDHFSLRRNGTEIQVIAPTAATLSWTDATPLTGTDTYDVFTITRDGFISDSSNDAVVTVAAADPAVAITDLKATLNP